MKLFVTKKRERQLIKDSLENLVVMCDTRLALGDPDFDSVLDMSATAAETLLGLWFDKKEES